MNEQNLHVALRAFTRRKPFGHFWIEFHSGDRVLVKHPEAAAVRGRLVTFMAPDRQQRLFDSTSVCQLIEKLPDQPLPTG